MPAVLLAALLLAQAGAAAPTRAQMLEAAAELMRGARYCTLVTLDADGQPQARIVDPFPPEPDMSVFIATKAASRKVVQIRGNPRVTLLCFDPAKQGYVSLLGTGTLVDEPKEKARRWKPEWKAFYDDENRGNDYLLIRVRPARLEILSPAHGLLNDPRTFQPLSIEMK